jgi:hypothetical protein
MNRSKEPRSTPTKTDQPYVPRDLGKRFREWQRLQKQVRDFERAAAHNMETIERPEQEIEKHRK